MMIKTLAALRNDDTVISNMTEKAKEPWILSKIGRGGCGRQDGKYAGIYKKTGENNGGRIFQSVLGHRREL